MSIPSKLPLPLILGVFGGVLFVIVVVVIGVVCYVKKKSAVDELSLEKTMTRDNASKPNNQNTYQTQTATPRRLAPSRRRPIRLALQSLRRGEQQSQRNALSCERFVRFVNAVFFVCISMYI